MKKPGFSEKLGFKKDETLSKKEDRTGILGCGVVQRDNSRVYSAAFNSDVHLAFPARSEGNNSGHRRAPRHLVEHLHGGAGRRDFVRIWYAFCILVGAKNFSG